MPIFGESKFTKIDFTENLSGRKSHKLALLTLVLFYSYKWECKIETISSAESRQQLKPDFAIKPSPPAIIKGFSFKIRAFGHFS